MDETLLIKFIAGDASLEEQKLVISWIEMSDENKKSFAQLKNITVAADILSEDYNRKQTKKKAYIKRLYSWSIRAAAIVVIAFICFYFGKNNEKKIWISNSREQFTEICVPIGESVSLLLPDGSSVKLNSGSVFRYSKLYGYKERDVYLKGEGYFNVKKGDKKFIVMTSLINVEVFGTEFNVSAYEEDRLVSASLYTGKVLVNNLSNNDKVLLTPNSSYTFDRVTEKSNVKPFNKKHNWTDNYFVANSDAIEFFVKKIERKYKVHIIINPKLIGKCIYTGTFKGESLEDILHNMALASPIKYKINENNTVTIEPKH